MIKISVSVEGLSFEIEYGNEKPKRNKGKSLLDFPDEYVVIDIETTGLSPEFDEIIEVCGLRVLNSKIVDKYCTLVKPRSEIPGFIERLTGITNDMVQNAPSIETVLLEFINFIGTSTLVAHNSHFDINFLYDYYLGISNLEFKNDFVDVLRISRKVYPELINHRLATLAAHLGTPYDHGHRALEDCLICNEVFLACKKHALERKLDIKHNHKHKLDPESILPETTKFDTGHPLFGKVCVFTGTLDKFIRKDAMQVVVNLGGSCKDNVTKHTNYLIMGAQDYSKFSDGEKSNKTKKAEQLILAGHDLAIITEDVFYDIIFDYALTNI